MVKNLKHLVNADILFPKEDELLARHSLLVEPKSNWDRNPPAFILNQKSGEYLQTPPQHTQITHSVIKTELDDCFFFGTHHFHAAITSSGSINLSEFNYNRICGRLDYYVNSVVDPNQLSPHIYKDNDVYKVNTTNLDVNDIQYVECPVFFGSPIEPDNFGMWLLEALPNIVYYLQEPRGKKLLIWVRMEWQSKLLEFMGVSRDDIIIQSPHKTYFLENITMMQYDYIDLVLTPKNKMLFATLRARALSLKKISPQKIFVSRRNVSKNGGARVLINEDELVEAMILRGFCVVNPETLDFNEQISIFASATVVVGVGGAAMFNTVFCFPGTKVISIESATTFAYGHTNLFSSNDLDYAFIYGTQDESDLNPTRSADHRRWFIDVENAVKFIDDFTC